MCCLISPLIVLLSMENSGLKNCPKSFWKCFSENALQLMSTITLSVNLLKISQELSTCCLLNLNPTSSTFFTLVTFLNIILLNNRAGILNAWELLSWLCRPCAAALYCLSLICQVPWFHITVSPSSKPISFRSQMPCDFT